MIRYLLDTDICIYAIKKKPFHLVNRLLEFGLGDLGVSSITVSELEYGIAKSDRPEKSRTALVSFLGALEVLPYGRRAAQEFGTIRAKLELAGTPIGFLDLLIAAHALALECPLITNNEREFSRVPGLLVENWARET